MAQELIMEAVIAMRNITKKFIMRKKKLQINLKKTKNRKKKITTIMKKMINTKKIQEKIRIINLYFFFFQFLNFFFRFMSMS